MEISTLEPDRVSLVPMEHCIPPVHPGTSAGEGSLWLPLCSREGTKTRGPREWSLIVTGLESRPLPHPQGWEFPTAPPANRPARPPSCSCSAPPSLTRESLAVGTSWPEAAAQVPPAKNRNTNLPTP